MSDPEKFYGISDLDHDPPLATSLGEMLIVWAAAETVLMMTLSCVLDTDLNQIEPAYYRIPTFEARTKFIRALLLEWETEEYNKTAISEAVDKLASLSATRNGWVHSVWCVKGKQSVIIDFRAAVGSKDRLRPVKGADVKNHNDAVRRRTENLQDEIRPWLDKYFGSPGGQARPPKPPRGNGPAK